MAELMNNEEKRKKALKELREAGYDARLEGGTITILVKENQELSREELIKFILIMQNNECPGYFQHPESCIVITDNQGIIMEHDEKLVMFSSREKFENFRKKFCPGKIRLFLHELKWEVIVKNFRGYFQEAILDCDGELDFGQKPVYRLIPLMESSEIGGMA
jgi:hypothetical protein